VQPSVKGTGFVRVSSLSNVGVVGNYEHNPVHEKYFEPVYRCRCCGGCGCIVACMWTSRSKNDQTPLEPTAAVGLPEATVATATATSLPPATASRPTAVAPTVAPSEATAVLATPTAPAAATPTLPSPAAATSEAPANEQLAECKSIDDANSRIDGIAREDRPNILSRVMPFIRRGDFDTACQLLDEFFARIGLDCTQVQSATPVPTQPRQSPTPRPTPTPTPAPTELITHLESGDIKVTVFDHDAVYLGTTIFMDFRDTANPSLVEVDIDGRITWEYPIPDEAKHPRVSGGPMWNGSSMATYFS